jgi:hypothetical protein
MRRPVGVKGSRFGICASRCFFPAESPLSPPFHPHSSMSGFDSLGASWVFSFQPVLLPDYRPRFHLQDESWARRLTQSPELGFRLLTFPFAEHFWFYAAAGIALNLLRRNGS